MIRRRPSSPSTSVVVMATATSPATALAAALFFLFLFSASVLIPPACAKSFFPGARMSLDDGYGRVTFAPGLRTLTFFDRSSPAPTPRDRYLKRLRAGLEAERTVRDDFAARRAELSAEDEVDLDSIDDDAFFDEGEYEQRVVQRHMALYREEDYECRAAFDAAFGAVEDDPVPPMNPEKVKNEYQFVGVVSPPQRGEGAELAATEVAAEENGGDDPAALTAAALSDDNVRWFARKKPKEADWSVRLVHVDRAAIFRDLFQRKKLDFYAEYRNVGRSTGDDGDDAGVGALAKPNVQPVYTARPRSWRTLFNVNPLNYFADRSGNSMRERRLPPGIYTDGRQVFETSYDYNLGRNGMKPLAGNLTSFLDETEFVGEATKRDLEERLKSAGPDVVVEF